MISESDIPKYRKRTKKVKKRYGVQGRWIAPFFDKMGLWHLWGKYETEKQRDQALEGFEKAWFRGRGVVEFRKVDL